MSGVLVSTIFEQSHSTAASLKNFNIDKAFLLVDKEAKPKQLNSVDLIKKVHGKVTDIVEKRVDVYDIQSVTSEVIHLIDSIPEADKIFVDISQGKKTQAIGVLLACYTRPERITKIVYWGEDGRMTLLPKLSFGINSKDKKVLRQIEEANTVKDLSRRISKSREHTYRYINKLKAWGLIEKENDRHILTDAGKIARL